MSFHLQKKNTIKIERAQLLDWCSASEVGCCAQLVQPHSGVNQTTTTTKKLSVSWKASLNRIIVRALGGGPLSLSPLGLDSNKCYCAADTHSSARDDPETRPAAVEVKQRNSLRLARPSHAR